MESARRRLSRRAVSRCSPIRHTRRPSGGRRAILADVDRSHSAAPSHGRRRSRSRSRRKRRSRRGGPAVSSTPRGPFRPRGHLTRVTVNSALGVDQIYHRLGPLARCLFDSFDGVRRRLPCRTFTHRTMSHDNEDGLGDALGPSDALETRHDKIKSRARQSPQNTVRAVDAVMSSVTSTPSALERDPIHRAESFE